MRKTPDFVKYAAGIVPDERQLKWQELGFNALVSYGMNTYTNSEWGNGNEDPELFAPTALDCRQWAKLCKLSRHQGAYTDRQASGRLLPLAERLHRPLRERVKVEAGQRRRGGRVRRRLP